MIYQYLYVSLGIKKNIYMNQWDQKIYMLVAIPSPLEKLFLHVLFSIIENFYVNKRPWVRSPVT